SQPLQRMGGVRRRFSLLLCLRRRKLQARTRPTTPFHPCRGQTMSETVGLIGLGLLGSALAERFLAAGHRIAGYDVDPARCTQLAQQGGSPLVSAREVIDSCPRVVLSLPDSDVVEAVLRDAASALRAGQLILDTTTSDPDRTTDVGLSLAQRS